MRGLHSAAMAALLSCDFGPHEYHIRRNTMDRALDLGSLSPTGVFFEKPRMATFVSPKRPTKRQRRRLRGKAQP